MIHIVPSVPPAVDGLGRYCYKLWEHWPEPRSAWGCLSIQVPDEAQEQWPEVELVKFQPNEGDLLRTLEASETRTVVLHYSGYGYQPKGSPVWLPRALRRWKRKYNGRLVVMFHELYTPGRRWSSSFWLYPFARKIVSDLVHLADAWVTSCPDYREKLLTEMRAPINKGSVLAVGADVIPQGEVNFSRPWPLQEGRKLKVVIFGQPNTRKWSLETHRNLLTKLCEQNLVESILLLGSKAEGVIEQQTQHLRDAIGESRFDVSWHTKSNLSIADISQVLLTQDMGLVTNRPGVLTKSLVYAALCEHGIVPLCSANFEGQSGVDDEGWPLPAGIINDDANPEVCLHQLHDEQAIALVQSRMQHAIQNELNWDKITQRWSQIAQV